MAGENGLTANSGDEENANYGQAGPTLWTQKHMDAGDRLQPRPVQGPERNPQDLRGRAPNSASVTVHCLSHNPSLAQVLVLTQSNRIGLHPPREGRGGEGR